MKMEINVDVKERLKKQKNSDKICAMMIKVVSPESQINHIKFAFDNIDRYIQKLLQHYVP